MALTIIEGNLGGDPEMRYTPSGIAVTEGSVAVSRPFKSPGSDAWEEETTWYRVTVWRDAAERFAQAKKGDFVRVTGRIQTDSWEVPGCPKGQHYGWRLIADRADVLGRFEKREGAGDFGRADRDAYVDSLAASRQSLGNPGEFHGAPVTSGVQTVRDELDDLPF